MTNREQVLWDAKYQKVDNHVGIPYQCWTPQQAGILEPKDHSEYIVSLENGSYPYAIVQVAFVGTPYTGEGKHIYRTAELFDDFDELQSYLRACGKLSEPGSQFSNSWD